jgi:hypothetical protein
MDHVVPAVEHDDPSILQIIKPLLVIVIIPRMEIEDVLADQNEFRDPIAHQGIGDLAFEIHNVVVEAVVPFTDHLYDAKSQVIIDIQYFDVKGGTPHVVPLGMDDIIVDGMRKLELTVFPAIKG